MRQTSVAVLFRFYLCVRPWLVCFTKGWWVTDDALETKRDDLKDLQELAHLRQRKLRRL